MSLRAITGIFILSLIAAIAVYDVTVLVLGGSRATISSVVYGAVYTRPWGALVPFALGVLAGHLLWGQR